jgi:NADPH2 dehydrogenase
MGSVGDGSSKLFQPFRLGQIELGHRVALAPLTRFRANDKHVHEVGLLSLSRLNDTQTEVVCHQNLGLEYYSQRASTPGTFLITEATLIHPKTGLYSNVPGLWR